MAAFPYLDFDLLVERTGDRYRARVLSSPGGEASTDFTLPFSSEQLQIFVLKAISLGSRRRVRRIESPDMQEIKTFGRELFEAVFGEELNDCLRLSLHEAEKNRAGLRIRLRLDDSGGDRRRPARTCHGSSCTTPEVPDSLPCPAPRPSCDIKISANRSSGSRSRLPLRLLVMISAPRDAPQLDVEHETAKLDEALRDPIEKGLVTVDRMEEATLQQLQRRLRQNEYHAFHFIGHGGYDERARAGCSCSRTSRARAIR